MIQYPLYKKCYKFIRSVPNSQNGFYYFEFALISYNVLVVQDVPVHVVIGVKIATFSSTSLLQSL
jgi:hypothetical protein